jgi:hypothetical protein
VNRFSDRRISQKKLVGFRIWRIFYTDLRILLIQRIADLSNILGRIVDLACNLVRILDCDFIVGRAFSGFRFREDHCRIGDFASNLGRSSDFTEKIARISDLTNILHGFADIINTAVCGYI